MFVGHAAIAALAGASRPRVPLLPLLVAAYAADAVEIVLHGLQLPHETAMLWSHSITALVGGGLVGAALAWIVSRRWDVASLVALVYASHGLCDLLTGERKPAWDGGPTYGMGLYERPAVDFAIEITLLLVAAAVYQWRRPARPRRLAIIVGTLVLLQLGFNLGDRTWLHGLKKDLVRASSAALAPAPARPPAGRGPT